MAGVFGPLRLSRTGVAKHTPRVVFCPGKLAAMVILGGTPIVRQVRQTCRPHGSAHRSGYTELVLPGIPRGLFLGG